MRLSLQTSEEEGKIKEYLEKNGWICIMPIKIIGSSLTKGISDIIAFKEMTLLVIEVKKTHELSKFQKQFKTDIENNGGIYIIGTNSDEIISKISELEKQRISFKENML